MKFSIVEFSNTATIGNEGPRRRGRPCKKDQKGMRMIVTSCETVFKFQACQYEKIKPSKQTRQRYSNSSGSNSTTITTNLAPYKRPDTATITTPETNPTNVGQSPQTSLTPSQPPQKTFRTSITIREIMN